MLLGWVVFWYLVVEVLLHGVYACGKTKPIERVISFVSALFNGVILYYVWLTLQGP